MILYIGIAILLFINSMLTKRISFWWIFILILISGFRAIYVGVDNVNYEWDFYKDIPSLSLGLALLKYEPLWIFLNTVIAGIHLSYQYIPFLSAVFTIIPIYYLSKKVSIYPSLTILLYVLLFYYFISFSLIRQFMAISFFMMGTYFMIEEKKLPSILFFILAACFHYSAIIVIPFIFLARRLKIEITKKNVFFFIFILLSTFLVGISGVMDKLQNLIELIPFHKYSGYFDYKSNETINRLNVYMSLIPQNILCFFLLKNLKQSIYVKLFFFGIILQNLFITFPQVGRLAFYFTIFEIFIIPELIDDSDIMDTRLATLIMILLYSMAYFVYFLISNRGGVIPYGLFFNN